MRPNEKELGALGTLAPNFHYFFFQEDKKTQANKVRKNCWKKKKSSSRVMNWWGTRSALSDWGPEPLKRVPKPFAQDHPHGDLLRRKNLTVTAEMPQDWRGIGVHAAVMSRVAALRPVFEVLAE